MIFEVLVHQINMAGQLYRQNQGILDYHCVLASQLESLRLQAYFVAKQSSLANPEKSRVQTLVDGLYSQFLQTYLTCVSKQGALAGDAGINLRLAALVRNVSAIVGYFFAVQTTEQGISSLLKLMNYAEDSAVGPPVVSGPENEQMQLLL